MLLPIRQDNLYLFLVTSLIISNLLPVKAVDSCSGLPWLTDTSCMLQVYLPVTSERKVTGVFTGNSRPASSPVFPIFPYIYIFSSPYISLYFPKFALYDMAYILRNFIICVVIARARAHIKALASGGRGPQTPSIYSL